MIRGVMKKISSGSSADRVCLTGCPATGCCPGSELRNVCRVVGLNDAANDDGTAVGDQYLRGRLLRDQSGVCR